MLIVSHVQCSGFTSKEVPLVQIWLQFQTFNRRQYTSTLGRHMDRETLALPTERWKMLEIFVPKVRLFATRNVSSKCQHFYFWQKQVFFVYLSWMFMAKCPFCNPTLRLSSAANI